MPLLESAVNAEARLDGSSPNRRTFDSMDEVTPPEMLSDAEWQELLTGCARDLPQAFLSMRQIAEAALEAEWQVPSAPADRPFARLPVYDTRHGQVALLHWRPGAVTATHDHRTARIFNLILHGDLAQRAWRKHQGQLQVVGERRGRAPDILLNSPGLTYSMVAPEGAVSLQVRVLTAPSRLLGDTEPISVPAKR